MHPFGVLVSDVWTDIHRIRHAVRRDEHPCQLPIPILERIVLISSDPGDVILDPFLGTGTTAIAAKTLGRHFIGIDLDPAYVEIAREKIALVEPSRYKGFYVSQFLGKLQSVRDVDASKLFPPQLTAPEKNRLRANGNGSHNQATVAVQSAPRLLEKRAAYIAHSKPAASKIKIKRAQIAR